MVGGDLEQSGPAAMRGGDDGGPGPQRGRDNNQRFNASFSSLCLSALYRSLSSNSRPVRSRQTAILSLIFFFGPGRFFFLNLLILVICSLSLTLSLRGELFSSGSNALCHRYSLH